MMIMLTTVECVVRRAPLHPEHCAIGRECGSAALAAPFYLDCSGTSVCWDSASDSVSPIFEAKNSKRFRPPTLAR